VDYRTPNIYDPSTLTEPYAYARGNPVMFWDPNGLSWLGDFAKHTYEYFASGQAAENLTAFVDGAVDGTVAAVVQVVTETGNMVHDLGNVSYSVHKYALTGELHEFEMRSAIGKSAEQGNDGIGGAARNLGGMAKGVVTAPLEMGKDLVSGDPRRMGQGLAKLEVALALAGARHGFTSPVSQVGKGVALDIKSTATTIIDKSKSLLSKKSSPPANITPPPTPTLSPNNAAFPSKVVNSRSYELRPSNGGSGPNRWHRVKPVSNVGSQNHHLVSNPIVKALENAGLSRDTALALRNNPALQKMSAPGGHVGYEKWHINYDKHMVRWLGKRTGNFKITDFFDEINRYYQSGEASVRIPGVNLGAPQ
jgi:hypothetical protein